MTKLLPMVGTAVFLAGCAGNFDWRKTAESITHGLCRDAGNCDVPCTLPESRRSECDPGRPLPFPRND